MKKVIFLGLFFLTVACAPVLNRDLMKEGRRNVSLDALRANPDTYTGNLYILGGLIIDSKFVPAGSQLEVLSLYVDSRGYLGDPGQTMGRFLAVYPKEKGLLDPMVYTKGRSVTLAGVFLNAEKRKVDEMEYVYPRFEIRQVYLWEEEPYYYTYPYPYPYYGAYWYNPYWGPWPPPPGLW